MTSDSTDSKKNRLCSAWERRDLSIDSSLNQLKKHSGMSRTVICTAMERLESEKEFDSDSLYYFNANKMRGQPLRASLSSYFSGRLFCNAPCFFYYPSAVFQLVRINSFRYASACTTSGFRLFFFRQMRLRGASVTGTMGMAATP